MIKLLIIGAGGGLGAIARYGLSGLVHRYLDGRFPYGTFLVNIIGCFLLGFFMFLVQNRGMYSVHVRQGVALGFIGAFTTYSTFAYETFQMITEHRMLEAAANLSVHIVVGLGAVWAAWLLGQALTS